MTAPSNSSDPKGTTHRSEGGAKTKPPGMTVAEAEGKAKTADDVKLNFSEEEEEEEAPKAKKSAKKEKKAKKAKGEKRKRSEKGSKKANKKAKKEKEPEPEKPKKKAAEVIRLDRRTAKIIAKGCDCQCMLATYVREMGDLME